MDHIENTSPNSPSVVESYGPAENIPLLLFIGGCLAAATVSGHIDSRPDYPHEKSPLNIFEIVDRFS
jgi:hypothetical protein